MGLVNIRELELFELLKAVITFPRRGVGFGMTPAAKPSNYFGPPSHLASFPGRTCFRNRPSTQANPLAMIFNLLIQARKQPLPFLACLASLFGPGLLVPAS